MLYLTCTTITSIDLAHYGVSRAKDWVSVKCGTIFFVGIMSLCNFCLETSLLYKLKPWQIFVLQKLVQSHANDVQSVIRTVM